MYSLILHSDGKNIPQEVDEKLEFRLKGEQHGFNPFFFKVNLSGADSESEELMSNGKPLTKKEKDTIAYPYTYIGIHYFDIPDFYDSTRKTVLDEDSVLYEFVTDNEKGWTVGELGNIINRFMNHSGDHRFFEGFTKDLPLSQKEIKMLPIVWNHTYSLKTGS